MTSEPIGEDDVGREPTGLETDLVDAIRARRAAETEATAFRNRLLAMRFTRVGLEAMAKAHRDKLKAEVRAS